MGGGGWRQRKRREKQPPGQAGEHSLHYQVPPLALMSLQPYFSEGERIG